MEHPQPVEIVRKTDQSTVGFACGTCGILFTTKKDDLTDVDEAKSAATQHCVRSCACGKPLDYHYYIICKDCRAAKEAEKEKARFEKATKVTIEDYDGPVFWNDKFFSDVDSLLDDLENDGVDVPEYVWATAPQNFELSASDILERELERQDMHEDAWDHIGKKAVDTLQAYFDVWCKEVGLVSYFEDTTRAVLLRPDALAEAG
jgi:hypothetical protein